MKDTNKTRRLKKYEAEATPCLKLNNNGSENEPIELYSPFGPMIARVNFPEKLTQRINDHADQITVADEGMEFIMPQDLIFMDDDQSIAAYLENVAAQFAHAVDGYSPQQVQLDTAWIVSQYSNTASPMHFHSSDISGVVYLKVPDIDTEEEQKSYIEARRGGQINFMLGGKQPLSKSLISFKPKVGACYLFPSWLLHGVEPFNGSGERRSMAFNVSYQNETA